VTLRREVVGLPEGGPTTLPLVKDHLRITDDRDDDRLVSIVAAVNTVVRCWPCAAAAVDAPDWSGASSVVEGATMLAARLFRRKGSPAGVEAFGSDGAVYVMRNDPDVAMLLQLGSWSGPSIG